MMNETGIDNKTYTLTETSVELNDRYAASLLPLTVIFGILLALGILGNILTLLVFLTSREYRGNTFKVFVIALALIDLATCVTLFPTEIMTHRNYFMFKSRGLCKAKCFVTVVGASASCLALLVISFDRYRKVMLPLRRQLSPSLAVVLLFLVIFIFPVLLAIPATIMCGIHHTSKENIFGGHTEIFLCETEERFNDSKWRTIYKSVLIILQLVISVVYVILYAFVMKEALKHLRAIRTRESFSSSLPPTIPSSITIDVLTAKPVHAHDENNKVASVKEENVTENSVSEMDDYSVVSEQADVSEGIPMQKDASKPSASRSRVRIKKSKSLISKRSRISIVSHKREFPTKTLVWFVLTLIFIVTNVTHLGLSMKRQEIVNMTTTELFWFLVFFRVYFINHVINPVVYALILKSFRTSCRNIFLNIIKRMKS